MKRALKWACAIILTPVIAIVLLMAAFYIPPVQRWVVKEISEYASEKSGLNITMQKATITFLLDLDLHQLHIDDHGKDILNVEKALVDLDFWRILVLKVGIEAVELQNGDIDTRDLIATLQLKGELKDFHLRADNVDLRHNLVTLNGATIDGCNLDIAMKDTTVVDTTESEPVRWGLDIEQVAIKKSQIMLHMPYDSMTLQAGLQEASLKGGDIDLEKGIYRIQKLKMQADSLHYDLPYEPRLKEGLDPSHITLYNLALDLENTIFKQQDNYLSMNLKNLQMKEKCGLSIDTLKANLMMDSRSMLLEGLKLVTMHSKVSGDANVEWRALKGRGELSAVLRARIGHQDILALAGNYLPKDLKRVYPQQPIEMDVAAYGNVDSLNITESRITMPTVIDIRTNGYVTNLMDSLHLSADMKWDVKTMNLNFIRQYLGLNNVNLPPMILHADTKLKDCNLLTADALLQEGRGNAHLRGNIDLNRMAYDAKMLINNLQIHDFLPHDSIYNLTANASIQGVGTDMLAAGTRMEAKAHIEHLRYASWDLDSVQVQAKLKQGEGRLEMTSNNDLLRLQACAETSIRQRKMTASSFNLDLNHINMYALGLAKKRVSASMVMHMEGDSDFDQTHNLTASIRALQMNVNDTIFYPEDLALTAHLNPSSIKAYAAAGDLIFHMESEQGLDSLLARSNNFTEELGRQIDSLHLDQDKLRTLLPYANIHLQSGQKNPVFNILNHVMGYKFREMHMNLTSNPESGLNGEGYMYHLNTGAILLDTISCQIRQKEEGLTMQGRVKNGPKNKVVSFESVINASLATNGAAAHVVVARVVSSNGRIGLAVIAIVSTHLIVVGTSLNRSVDVLIVRGTGLGNLTDHDITHSRVGRTVHIVLHNVGTVHEAQVGRLAHHFGVAQHARAGLHDCRLLDGDVLNHAALAFVRHVAADHPAVARYASAGNIHPFGTVQAHPTVVRIASVGASIGRICAVLAERNPQVLSAVDGDRRRQRHLMEGVGTNRVVVHRAHQSGRSRCATEIDVHGHHIGVVAVLIQGNLRQVRACIRSNRCSREHGAPVDHTTANTDARGIGAVVVVQPLADRSSGLFTPPHLD